MGGGGGGGICTDRVGVDVVSSCTTCVGFIVGGAVGGLFIIELRGILVILRKVEMGAIILVVVRGVVLVGEQEEEI